MTLRLKVRVGWLLMLTAVVAASAGRPARAQSAPPADRNGPHHGQYYVKPTRIIGNLHFVGFSNNTSWLITTPEGHILIDPIYEDTVPQMAKNIQDLGFDPKDIKYILNAHAHSDHVNGLAAMKELTGGRILAMDSEVGTIEDGGVSDVRNDGRQLWRPVKVDQAIHDGHEVKLGGMTLVARKTAGHTKGCTTWTTVIEDGGRKYDAVFICSLGLNGGVSLVNNPKYPTVAEDYAPSFDVLRSLPCDLFFVSHTQHFNFFEKLDKLQQGGGANPFIDPQGYKDYIVRFETGFKEQLEKDKLAAASR